MYRKKISYGKQYIDKKDIKSVIDTLKKERITTGDMVDKFEKKINNFFNSKFSLTCNSGTSALFLAFQAINIKKNDSIIMPSINFVSSYNVAKLFGAKVFLADVDKSTGQMQPGDVINCCKKFKLKKIKALIVMYNGGYPENANNFKKFKKKLGCVIIEDACHALGAEYINKKKKYKIGSCNHSDISTFSLHPLKTITTGEGGIVTTNSKTYYNKIKRLRSIGIERKKLCHWKYDVLQNGFNFRLTDFQCALGISQLAKIKKFIKKRKIIAKNYMKNLKNIPTISFPIHNKNYISSHHLFLINLKKFNLVKKDRFINYMKSKKIYLQYHYIPVYNFKIFEGKFINKNSEIYYNTTISLPIYYTLSTKEQNYVINCIKNYFK